MNYLDKEGDFDKYDNVKYELLWGKQNQPVKYSIIIPTYNRLKLLKQSIQSALNQDQSISYEIVIVDNNSENFNLTLEYIQKINNKRISYYRNEKNIGIYGNTLRAAKIAKGKYVILLNDDDLLHGCYLHTIELFISKYKYHGIIGCFPYSFRDDLFKEYIPEKDIRAIRVSQLEFFLGCCVTSPGILYPKEILRDVYNMHEELLMGDQINQFKSLINYQLILIVFPLSGYRIGNNATLKDTVVSEMILNMLQFRKQCCDYNLFLKLINKLIFQRYSTWYIKQTLHFWKKRHLFSDILKLCGISTNYAESNYQKYFDLAIESVNNYFKFKHKWIYDFVSTNDDFFKRYMEK